MTPLLARLLSKGRSWVLLLVSIVGSVYKWVVIFSAFVLIAMPASAALAFVIDPVLLGLTLLVPTAILLWILVALPLLFFPRTRAIALSGTIFGHLLLGAAAWLLAFKVIIDFGGITFVPVVAGVDIVIDNTLMQRPRAKALELRSYLTMPALGSLFSASGSVTITIATLLVMTYALRMLSVYVRSWPAPPQGQGAEAWGPARRVLSAFGSRRVEKTPRDQDNGARV